MAERAEPDAGRLPCGCSTTLEEFIEMRRDSVRNSEDGPFPSAERDPEISRSVARFLAPYVGEWQGVVHERRSWLVYVEVHLHGPTEKHPYVDLFTTGMSQRPMDDPHARQHGLPDRAELLMQFPGAWAGGENLLDATRRLEKVWPVLWLRRFARMPHERRDTLRHGSVRYYDPHVLQPGTRFEGALFVDTAWTDVGIAPLIRPDLTATDFLDVIPVHESEIAYAADHEDGGLRLADELRRAGVDHTIFEDREPVV